MPLTARPSIRVEGLSKSFDVAGGRRIEALRNIDLDVADGEFVCLVGPSGCGKSTLLNTIAGFVDPTVGRCLFDGEPVKGPSPERGVVFQEYGVFPWMTVRKNVEFGLKVARMPRAERQELVDRVLGIVGLQKFAGQYPKSLSGGMKQRVAIARVLALNPRVMLMDEPFGALDALTRSSLQTELEQIWLREKPAVVFVTHNVEEAVLLADRVVLMSPHPGQVQAVVPVTLERPRKATDPEFNRLREHLTSMLMHGAEASVAL
jgi:NitT/TauT family transport system ATP-binding protein